MYCNLVDALSALKYAYFLRNACLQHAFESSGGIKILRSRQEGGSMCLQQENNEVCMYSCNNEMQFRFITVSFQMEQVNGSGYKASPFKFISITRFYPLHGLYYIWKGSFDVRGGLSVIPTYLIAFILKRMLVYICLFVYMCK